MGFPFCSLLFCSSRFFLMSYQGAYDRKHYSRRSSLVPRGTTSASVNGSHDIGPCDPEDCPSLLGFPVSPLECECDGRTSIDATVVFDISPAAPSTHNTPQVKFETTGRAPFLSLTYAAGSAEQ